MNIKSLRGRRLFLKQAAHSFLGVNIASAFSATQSQAAEEKNPSRVKPRKNGAKSVIMVYLAGGCTHVDTFDPNEHDKANSPLKLIPTSADGIKATEWVPKTAKKMHHIAVINSMISTQGAHSPGSYFMHTAYHQRGTIKHPGLGPWMEVLRGKRGNADLPGSFLIGSSGLGDEGFLPPQYTPAFGKINDVELRPGDTFDALDRRLDLASKVGLEFRRRYQKTRSVQAYNAMYADAVRVMKSKDLEVFDLTKEPDSVRELYQKSGEGALLARRLVQRGVQFVEVVLGGFDTHFDSMGAPGPVSNFDHVFGTLLTDLESQGMLDETLVVMSTEFGRTPIINESAGRHHYPQRFTCLLAGGGIRGGQAYGERAKNGTVDLVPQVTVPDFHKTIAYGAGLDINRQVYSPSKRPFQVGSEDGKPLTHLFNS